MASKIALARLIRRQRQFAEREIGIVLANVGDDLKAQHDAVVRSWEHKPQFRIKKINRPHMQTVQIVPFGIYKEIWTYVDKGTKPHIIAAKNAPFLKFRTGYSARTAPVARANVGTGTATGQWVQKTEVQHPGNEARKFTETFLKDIDPPLDERIQAAIQRGYDKANK